MISYYHYEHSLELYPVDKRPTDSFQNSVTQSSHMLTVLTGALHNRGMQVTALNINCRKLGDYGRIEFEIGANATHTQKIKNAI